MANLSDEEKRELKDELKQEMQREQTKKALISVVIFPFVACPLVCGVWIALDYRGILRTIEILSGG